MKTKTAVDKSAVLLSYLKDNDYPETTADDIAETSYDENMFEAHGREYLVLTDNEADEKAAESIKDSTWAFNKSFLDGHSAIIADLDDKTWAAVVSRCESSNSAVLRMIDDVDHFINDAIATDGRGHFLNTYDGKENEIKVDGVCYFVYRTN